MNRSALVLSQVYVPDPASVGQHMHDAACELANRGFRVQVFAAARGYDDPSARYLKQESLDGVEVRRFGFTSFGKRRMVFRLLGGGIFVVRSALAGVFLRRLSVLLVSTSPPMCPLAALFISWVRRVPIKYWVMDVNPDQVVALGQLKETSLPVRGFNWLNRSILERAKDVIVLDEHMAKRMLLKVLDPEKVKKKLHILPPWPHTAHLHPIGHEENPFRSEHGLQDKFVVMYSGNHGKSNPVTTILQAALQLQDEERLVFLFVGGGNSKKEVDDTIAKHRPSNIRSLPYLPLNEISRSLSAADIHLVTVGDTVVGVVHPCKIYGAMAVARPVLLVGPNPCHVSALVADEEIGWHISHGDVDTAVRVLSTILRTPSSELKEMGLRARKIIEERLSQERLLNQFGDILVSGLETACVE